MVQLLGGAILIGGLLAVVAATIASASAPTEGSSVPDSAVPVAPFNANTPFASGQGINIVVPANSIFSATTNLNIVECSAPDGVIPTQTSACDGNTIQGPTLKSNADGSVNFQAEEKQQLYTVYALPDLYSLLESSGPACGNTAATECILYIGYDQNDFTQPHVWSQPFFINTNPTDSGTPAGDGSAPPVATAPSASLSTVVASPTTNTANGQDASFVTVTLLGTGSVPVAGKTVSLAGSGNQSIVPAQSGSNVTDADGVATFTTTDEKVETVTYTATDSTDSVTLDQQPTVDFEAQVVTASNSNVEASAVASGSTTITVTIGDQGLPPDGTNPGGVAGQTVQLAGSPSGTVQITPASTGSNVTNAQGVATFTATDSASEVVTFTATDTTDNNLVIPNTATATFGTLTVSNTASTVTAVSPGLVGQGTAVVVTLFTAGGSPVSGKSVSLTTSSTTASVETSPLTTGANGEASFTVTDSAAESDTFTATDVTDSIPITQVATVVFQVPAPSAAQSTVAVGSPTDVADGQTFDTVTVTINSQFGAPVSGKTVTLAVTGSALEHPISQGGSQVGVTDANGRAYFDVDDTVAEPVTVTATDKTDNFTVMQTASITFTIGAADPYVGTSTVQASNPNPPNDGTTATTITVTLTDLYGNDVPGKTISLSAANPVGNTAQIQTISAVTNTKGQATFSATDTTAEVVVFDATDVTDANTPFVADAVVTFGNPPVPPAVAAFSSVVATPSSVPADGATTSTISVLLYNGAGDAVPGRVVTLKASGGNSTVTAVNGTTNTAGNALFTVTDTTAESVTYTADDTTDSVDLSADPVTVQFTTANGSTTTTTTTTTTGSGSTTTTTAGSGATTTTTAANGSTTTTTTAGSSIVQTSGDATDTGSGSSGSGDSALAFTGVPPLLPWLVGIGALLVGVGTMGRRRHTLRSET